MAESLRPSVSRFVCVQQFSIGISLSVTSGGVPEIPKGAEAAFGQIERPELVFADVLMHAGTPRTAGRKREGDRHRRADRIEFNALPR